MTSPHAWYGYRRDGRDPRDLMYSPRQVLLPARVDLRDDLPPVLNQGSLGSCVLNAATVALRYCLLRSGLQAPPLSRLQAYYDVRKVEGTLAEDSGCEIRDAIKCAAKIGVGQEKLWPYKVGQFKKKPTDAVYKDAINFNAMKYERVAININAIKDAIAQALPVIFGIELFASFEGKEVERTGVVPMPLRSEQPVGGHAMLAVGYGQKKGYFTARNSWAADWGDEGDCYLPEAYVGSSKYGGDYWVVSLVG